ncbi:MAG: hypothetical protein HYZ14_12785 [Bacteroidetes bacterium]|nr:hypothetical protein [Bacteroidota bacterium]
MKRKKQYGFALLIGILSIFSVACAGSDSSETTNPDVTDEKKEDCAKESADDFDNFLGIEYGTNELKLEKILGSFTGGAYTADSLAFMYYFKTIENAPITVWVNAKSQKVETIFMEVLSYEQYFQEDLKKAAEEYNIQSCDSKFFGMKKDEIVKIMGKPAADEALEGGVQSISYDSKNYKYSVNFKFYPEQNNICSSISVNWFY